MTSSRSWSHGIPGFLVRCTFSIKDLLEHGPEWHFRSVSDSLQRRHWVTNAAGLSCRRLSTAGWMLLWCLDPALNSLCYKVFRSARSTEPHLVTSRALEPISEIMNTLSFLEDNPVRLILDIQSFSPTVTLHGAVISEIYLHVWVSMQSLPARRPYCHWIGSYN